MDDIVDSAGRVRTWPFARRRLLAGTAVALALTGVVSVAFAAGWWAHGGVATMPPEVQQALASQISQERAGIEQAREEARDSTRAVSQRIADLQAHVVRLDAAGARMTEIAGVDPSEFNFAGPPAVGGPEEADQDEPDDGDPVLASLRTYEGRLDDREQRMEILEDLLLAGRRVKQKKPSGWPVTNGYMSSGYGWRADPFDGRRSLHAGLDFAGREGSDVRAVAAGTVTAAELRAGYGMVVEIDHGNGYVTRYGHNERLLVQPGDHVTKGEPIAAMGSSGRSTGPHVHFELLLNGLAVNPQAYIAATR